MQARQKAGIFTTRYRNYENVAPVWNPFMLQPKCIRNASVWTQTQTLLTTQALFCMLLLSVWASHTKTLFTGKNFVIINNSKVSIFQQVMWSQHEKTTLGVQHLKNTSKIVLISFSCVFEEEKIDSTLLKSPYYAVLDFSSCAAHCASLTLWHIALRNVLKSTWKLRGTFFLITEYHCHVTAPFLLTAIEVQGDSEHLTPQALI